MMRFDIITLFPEGLGTYLDTSILKRAQTEKYIEVHAHQLRDFTIDKHRTVDDTPYGGGAGMVLKIEPLVAALENVLLQSDIPRAETRVIVTSAKGSTLTQKMAQEFSVRYKRIILICGRYEGIDERFIEHFCDEELSIGDYVLTGGELAALIVVDSVSRLIPGVLGNEESALTESHTTEGVLEHPQYTKPEAFREYVVPEVLISGHHENIKRWRESKQQDSLLKEE
jgi:tRNA (guanine37-N1)-methyltransferase